MRARTECNRHSALKGLLREYGLLLARGGGYPTMCPIGRLRARGAGGMPVFSSRVPLGVELPEWAYALSQALFQAERTNGTAIMVVRARYIFDRPVRAVAEQFHLGETSVFRLAALGLDILTRIGGNGLDKPGEKCSQSANLP